jgi:hypothetical protein
LAITEKLINAVLIQIHNDLTSNNDTAVAELLESCPEERLRSYLPESNEESKGPCNSIKLMEE